MFTGLIEEIGQIAGVELGADAARLTVRGPLVVSDATHGASISVSGVCLTVVESGPDWFTADVMAQTLTMSTLGDVREGTAVNLERAAQVGDRLGGHIVQGHVDGSAEVLSVTDGSAWRVVRFTLPADLAPLVAGKGSIAVDGVSLTVSAVGNGAAGNGAAGNGAVGNGADDSAGSVHWFEVSLIPETLTATTLGGLTPGSRVNLETDLLARHVARMLQFDERSEG